jgi:hypothetical protein
MNNKLQKNDSIVIINGIELVGIKAGYSNTRNVICKSNKVAKFIIDNKLNINNIKDLELLSNLVDNNYFDDIEVIDIDGYY